MCFGNERNVSKFKAADKGGVKKTATLEVNAGTEKPHILHQDKGCPQGKRLPSREGPAFKIANSSERREFELKKPQQGLSPRKQNHLGKYILKLHFKGHCGPTGPGCFSKEQ